MMTNMILWYVSKNIIWYNLQNSKYQSIILLYWNLKDTIYHCHILCRKWINLCNGFSFPSSVKDPLAVLNVFMQLLFDAGTSWKWNILFNGFTFQSSVKDLVAILLELTSKLQYISLPSIMLKYLFNGILFQSNVPLRRQCSLLNFSLQRKLLSS